MTAAAFHNRSFRIAAVAGAFAVLVGGAVLSGWAAGLEPVTRVRRDWTPTMPLTAVCFVLAGAALLCLSRAQASADRGGRAWREAALALGAAVGLAGVWRLALHLVGHRTAWDTLGFFATPGEDQIPLLTAVGLALAGAALLANARRVFHPVAQAMAALLLLLGWIGLARYLYGGDTRGVPFLMSMPSALLFAVLGAGLVFARPDGGFVRIWNADTAGSMLFRRLLPTAMVVPVVLGWIRLLGQRAGWYGLETGLAIFAMSNVAVFALVAWRTAERLHREDLRRREAERSTREERDFSNALIDSLPGVFYLYDREGRFLRWNRNFERVTGRGPAEIRDMHPLDFFAEGEKELLRERIGEVFAKGVSEVEAGFLSKDGRSTPYFFTGIALDYRGQPCLAGVGIDITERVGAEAQVRELNADLERRVVARTAELAAKNRELETFTYSVSHDLKAPLRGIDGYSRLLQEDHADRLDEEGRRFLASVRQASQQMGQLIDDLLAYSQVERRALRLTGVDPRAVLASLPSSYADEMRTRGVEWVVDLPEARANADANGLAQILRNLLDNALKFTRDVASPRIEVRGRAEAGRYLLLVRDNGIGFDMRFAERVFEIFQRLHRVEDYPGTGIGLAIVRKAMERMGGRVWAESEPGRGATFYLELPLQP
jgi:PAS domain S-box-containing protein